MRAIVMALALFALIPAARADSITITLQSASGACVSGCTKTFADSSNQLQTKILTDWGPLCAASTGASCNAGQTLVYFAAWLRDAVVDQMRRSETGVLKNNAIAGYAPINPK